jgi:ribosome-associated protein
VVIIPIKTDYIRLAQLLKLADAVQDGAEAKFRILNEDVKVNNVIEIRRGRKVRIGDQVEINGTIYTLVPSDFTK